LQQAKDNSKHLSNLTVNTAKTFEQNSRQLASAVSEASSNNSNSQNRNDNDSAGSKTTYSNTTATATTTK
ncbi:MAG: hypothetical protein H0X50_11910, partial [Nitrosopumilus sp.]|nr:hypothetical protein [Nitrosopumilus sp.]